jgi:hypothetical protein
VSKHPANEVFEHDNGKVHFPAGTYRVTPGLQTPGNLNTELWRVPMNLRKADLKKELRKANPKWSDDLVEKTAKTQVADEVNKSFGNRYKLPWQELYLVGWDEHHIHPVNWGGAPADNGNLVYLKSYEHARFTTYFDDRKRDILRELSGKKGS